MRTCRYQGFTMATGPGSKSLRALRKMRLLSLFSKTAEDDARREEAREVAAMGALNATADLGFFLGPVAGGDFGRVGVKWGLRCTCGNSACGDMAGRRRRRHLKFIDSQISRTVASRSSRLELFVL